MASTRPAPIDQLAALRYQLRAILRRWALAGSLTAGETSTLDPKAGIEHAFSCVRITQWSSAMPCLVAPTTLVRASNTASRRVIESSGAVPAGVPDGECRYWIGPPEADSQPS
jgi:hypothetical protein